MQEEQQEQPEEEQQAQSEIEMGNKEAGQKGTDNQQAALAEASESVIPLPKKINVGIGFNIEVLRLFGLCAGIFLLIVGKTITDNFVDYPVGSGGFDPEATYIFELFHFNHTCTVLDFNPSKTISALVVMLSSLPLAVFSVLSYFRAREDYLQGQVPKKLYMFSRITTPINFLSFIYFYMVFVNSPYDKSSFTLHYIPYMFYQIALMLMAYEQCFYVIVRGIIPFNLPVLSVKIYIGLLITVCSMYTIFVWSFLLDIPVLDTTKAGPRGFAMFIMYFFDLLAVMMPAVFAGVHVYNTKRDRQTCYLAFYDMDSI